MMGGGAPSLTRVRDTFPRAYEEEHDQSDRFAAATGSTHPLVHPAQQPRRHALRRGPRRRNRRPLVRGAEALPTPHELGTFIENPEGYLREHGTAEDNEPAGEYAAAQLLALATTQLDEYFERRRTTFDLPLDPEGTDFQLIVWEHLKTVPAGYTTTYGAISRAVGPGAPAQAVGQAVGRNKISIMIPCHRVVGADGSMTGYAGGVDRKRFLLALEEPSEVRETRLF